MTVASSAIQEKQVCGTPPPTTGGWYPAGEYALTAATLYAPACADAGTPAVSYAGALQVSADKSNPSIDHYKIVQTQDGCGDITAEFSGDTFGHPGDEPYDHLSSVSWTCPACPNCGTKMKYSATKTSLTLHFPLSDGSTLVEEFTLRVPAP